MKKTVYVCDKCRKEVAEENVIREHDFDFCEACAKKLDDLITDWVMKVEKKPKQKKEKVEKTLKELGWEGLKERGINEEVFD